MTDTATAERGAEVAGRVGLTARGTVYCLLALLALQVAFGREEERLDRQGALRAVARQRFGAVLLLALAAGFAAYALWRFAEAVLGDDDLHKRLLHAARGGLYAAFTVSTVRLLVRHRSGTSNDQQAKSWSARFLELGWGRPLMVVAGAGIVIGGGVLAWRGLHKKFEKHLRTGEMRGWQRRWLPWLGTAGHGARGVVVALVGLFLIRSAVTFDPQEAVGVDGALHQLAGRPYGVVALGLVALGLGCYGLYSFVEARWRKLLD